MWFGDGTVFTSASPLVGSAFAGSGVRVLGTSGIIGSREVVRQNTWAYAGLNAIARGVAKTPLKVFQFEDGTQRRRRLYGRGSDAHPLAKLIDRPWKGGTAFRLKNRIVVEYLLSDTGKAYVWKVRTSPSGLPVELLPLRSDLVTPMYASGKLAYYQWSDLTSGHTEKILPENVIEIGFEDDLSPFTVLAKTLAIDLAAQETTASFYENGAVIGNVITTEQNVTPKESEQIAAELRATNSGPSNAFKTLVLSHLRGAKIHQVGMSSADAQTIEHRKLSREEVAAALGIPQPVIGILDRATFSNIETQTRMWIVDTLGAHFAMIESALMGQLIDAERSWENCFVEFDTGEVLRGTPTQRAETYLKWLHAGTRSVNELRALENLPPIEHDWADAVWVPVNLIPVGAGLEPSQVLPATATPADAKSLVFAGINPWQSSDDKESSE